MIPQDKTEAVIQALREAFGVTAFDDISPMTGGHTSSLVFRITVRGAPYLLKLILRTDDATRHFASMRAAAAAGVAPRVWYTSVEDRVFITDFINPMPQQRTEALARLPVLLRTLHALPPFERAPFNTTCTFLLNQSPMLDGLLQRLRPSNALSPEDTDVFFARLAELVAVYAHGEDMVSCHNDVFKPDNILFDGARVWLVDWEPAFLNDRYADVAAVANMVVTNEEEESAYLRAYLGVAPDAYQRARLHLMQQVTHLFYTLAFLGLAGPATSIDWGTPAPSFTEYHRRMWAGEVDLSDAAAKIILGRVHWQQFLDSVRQARYADSLRVVRQGHALR